MSFHLKISGDSTLEIRYSGTVTKEEISAVWENAVVMINSNNLKRVFIDTRKAQSNISYGDLFDFAATKKMAYPKIRRCALLSTPSSILSEEIRMYCKVANKRGFKMKAFSDLNKCKTWLNS